MIVIGQFGYPPSQYKKDLKILLKCKGLYPIEELVTHEFKIEEAEKGIKATKKLETMKAVIYHNPPLIRLTHHLTVIDIPQKHCTSKRKSHTF